MEMDKKEYEGWENYDISQITANELNDRAGRYAAGLFMVELSIYTFPRSRNSRGL